MSRARTRIFHVQYEAAPGLRSADRDTVDGAFVNCWVRARSKNEAQTRARATVDEIGWTIITVTEECEEVSEHSYRDNDIGRAHYEQALLDGECYTFDRWPLR